MTAAPRVFVRLRPPSEYEAEKRRRRVVEVVDRSTVAVVDDGQEFTCHGVFDEGFSSDSVYKESCQNVPQHLLEGYHCTILAYGVSGSGRSQTIQDVTRPLIHDLFDALGNTADLQECSIRCSVVEIYLERLRDLLHEPSTVQLHTNGALQGCTAVACVSAEDVLDIVDRARLVQTASAVIPNAKSNRSTAVIQLSIQQTLWDGTHTSSRLQIMDLLACELVRPAKNDSLEATQVSLSLKALHKQIRHFASGRPPIPLSDIPVLAQLLSFSFSSTNLSIFLTMSPCAPGAESLFKFGSDCKQVRLSLERHRHPLNRKPNDSWKILARTLAIECERSGIANDPKLTHLIDKIRNNELDFEESSVSAGQNHDRLVQETERVKSERDQLCSDLAILQAQSMALNGQNQKMRQDLDRLEADLRALQLQRHQMEETLRISQFREAEAVVFLRQLRRFYFRLLQKTLAEGTPDALSMQLIDMDHFMMQSGLLEENEVGGDVSIDCRPSRQSLERSIAERERATNQAIEPPPNWVDDGETASLDDQTPLPVSVGAREPCEKVEARQKLFKTPAGRYIAMKEKRLEQEVQQLTEINGQLKTRLSEAMTNVDALCAKDGFAASLDKMRVAQEIRSLKEHIDRKNNDIKAIIWKMNELHMVGKTLQSQAQNKDQHMSHLEQTLLDLQAKHGAVIEDRRNEDSKLRQSLTHLKSQLRSLLVPVWQLSSDRKARSVPLQGRLIIPMTNVSIDQLETCSLGEPGEWAHLGVLPAKIGCADVFTQTDGIETQNESSQTIESVYSIDRANTKSTEVQTDNASMDTNGRDLWINDSNIESLMFVLSPADVQKPRVSHISNELLSGYDGSCGNTGRSDHLVGSIQNYSRYLATDKSPRDIGAAPELTADQTEQIESEEETEFDSRIYQSYISGNFNFGAKNSNGMDKQKSEGPSPEQAGAVAETVSVNDFSPSQLSNLYCEKPNLVVETPDNVASNLENQTIHNFVPRGISGAANASASIVTGAKDTLQNNAQSSDRPLPNVRAGEKLSSPVDRGQSDLEPGIAEGLAIKDLVPDSSDVAASGPLENAALTLGNDEDLMPGESTAVRSGKMAERGTVRATKSEVSPVATKRPKNTNRNLSSFLDRLQSQAKKRLEDDEKTETPEFMKLFKKIGGKNQNEAVVEASGAVTSRDAQRTSFEQLKLGHQKVVDPRQLEAPSRSWKPRKKKPTSDSDSDDDSFAKSFMRGAQMAKPDNDSGQATHQGRQFVDGSESSDDDSFAKSFMKGAAMLPSDNNATSINHESDSSSSSENANGVISQKFVATMDSKGEPKNSFCRDSPPSSDFKAQDHLTAQESGDSSSDENSSPTKAHSAKTDPPVRDSVNSPPTTSVSPKFSDEKTSDSESSSSSSDGRVPARKASTSPRNESPQRPLQGLASVQEVKLPQTGAVGRTSPSSSDSSSESSKPSPSARLTLHPLKPKGKSVDSSSEESSDSTCNSTVLQRQPAQKQPVNSTAVVSSSNDDSSDDSAKEPPQGRVSAFQKRDEPAESSSDESNSSDDSFSSNGKLKPSATKKNPGHNATVQQQTKDSSSSAGETSVSEDSSTALEKQTYDVGRAVKQPSLDGSSSSNDSNKVPRKQPCLPKIIATPSSSEESDSSDSRVAKTKGPTLTKKSNVGVASSSDESSSSSSDEGDQVERLPQKNPNTDESDDTSGADEKEKAFDSVVNKKDAHSVPKTSVPDYAAILNAAAKAKGKKKKPANRSGPKSDFVIKDGKIVRRTLADGEESGKKKKIKVKIKKTPNSPGSQVSGSSGNESSPRRRPRRKSLVKDNKFEIKNGKLVRKKGETSSATKSTKSSSFRIVDGKLVKDGSVSSQDSEKTEKA